MSVDRFGSEEAWTVATLDWAAARPDAVRLFQRAVARVAGLAVEIRDPQRLAQHVLKAAAEALHAEQAAVYLLDDVRPEFGIAAAIGLLPSECIGMRIPNRHETLASDVVARGHALVVANPYHEPGAEDAPGGRASRWRRALAAPLFDGGRVIGVIAVGARATKRFGSEDVRFLETLSSLLASSLQRARSDEALSHSRGLKSIGQLTGGMAHDFDNLLSVISGSLELLEDCPAIADDEDARYTLAAAACAARRGAELAGKLLAFSRRQELRAAPLNVGGLLHPLADLLSRTLDQRIRVTVDVAPDCPPCLVDAGQLESTLLNLAINARDAMWDGGTLSFRAWPVDDLPSEAGTNHPSAGDTGYVAIAVGDTGAGMSDAVKQRVLEPFFTTKEAGQGAGLGLSAAFGFAEQSQGALVLDSTLGRGTTITLFLPQHCEAAVARGATWVALAPVPAFACRPPLVTRDAAR